MSGARCFALLLLLSGCASTRIYSGKPPGATATGYDARWHSALLLGAAPAHDEYHLDELCKRGWSELRLEPDAFTFLASLATLFIYTPSRLTVVCAAEPGSGRPTLREYPAPGTRR